MVNNFAWQSFIHLFAAMWMLKTGAEFSVLRDGVPPWVHVAGTASYVAIAFVIMAVYCRHAYRILSSN